MFELNLPNVLTVLRILLVPVLVAALLQEAGGGDALAAIVFALASFTDALDGWIARRQKSVSTFGKLMDPLADKLLVTAALVSLVSLDRVSAWVAMVIIAREFAVTGACASWPWSTARSSPRASGASSRPSSRWPWSWCSSPSTARPPG
jgi:CDP-diacylglycerol---glycerol-3-phosphate 3-phosphatidyltransferase